MELSKDFLKEGSASSGEDKKNNKKEYLELVHVDLPLCLVEIHYEQESALEIPYSYEKFDIIPYIFYERKNNLTYLFYDKDGINWQKKIAANYKKEEYAIKLIVEKYDKIKEIVENEKVLNKEDFMKFLGDLRDIWPWLNYMWWAIEYRDENNESFDELLKIRKYTEYFTPGIIAVCKKSLSNIFFEKRKYVDVLLLEEIESGIFPEDEILDRRIKYYAYTDGLFFKSSEDIFNKYNIKLVSKNFDDNILSGRVACPGKAIGRVRIINKREDIVDFKHGEILISSTTTPDFLPAMEKSAAIISAHGGALCHAAIVSRELNVPCVVGVEGIDMILNNGDLVEVNADEGIIKIIERV